jgi:four helix bundle protein
MEKCMKDYRTLKVWQKSHKLTLAIYKVTRSFPREELFGLTGQMRRSSSSIPQNIAEGCGRGSDADFARFLQISMGSASELDYEILLSYDLQYLDESNYKYLSKETIEVMKMLTSLIKKLHKDINN